MTGPRVFMALLLALMIFPAQRSEAKQSAYYAQDYQEEAPSYEEPPSDDGDATIIQRRDAREDDGRRDSDRDRRKSERQRHRKKKPSQMDYLKQFHYTTGKIQATTQGQNSRER